MTNTYLEEFCTSNNFKNSINVPTCFRKPENQTGIDQILRNQPESFHSSGVYETCLSDLHKLTSSVLKDFTKFQWDFDQFDNASSRADFRQKLSFQNV